MGRSLYQRSHCDKTFPRNSNLIRHLRTHAGEKTYQCSQYDKAISDNGNLIQHLRIHTGEKPYQCDKAFSQNSDLKRHMRTLGISHVNAANVTILFHRIVIS